jgi:formate dehydrogenase major subunit
LNLSFLTDARLFPVSGECNALGWDAMHREFPGKIKSVQSILHGIKKGSYKALFTAASVSLPQDVDLEFLVVQDSYKGEYWDRADVVLPAAVLPETRGTIVNTEGRIQSLNSPLDVSTEARPDWKIISELAQKMGSEDFPYETEKDIRKELAQKIPAFKDVDQIGPKRKKAVFVTRNGESRKKMIPLNLSFDTQKPSQKYPFQLVLDPCLDSYRSCVLSEEVIEFGMFRNSRWIKVNTEDAQENDLKQGDPVTLESEKGKVKGQVHISQSVPRGIATVFWLPQKKGEMEGWNSTPVRIVRGK